MTPPLIRVEDHTTTPAITLVYISGNNAIHFPTAYTQIKSLLKPPSCTHRRSEDTWPCPACETAFTTPYWTCAATLLDYCADFYATDSAAMQAVWFHLLDIWQETAHHLPYEAVLEDGAESEQPVWGAEAACAFEKDVRDTVELFDITICGRRKDGQMGDSVIYDPRGEAYCPVGEYETGPWISGVKPWAQFLGAGGPGVVAPSLPPEGQVGADTRRYVPMPAIATIKTHTERARTLAERLFETEDPDNLTQALDSFDQHSLHFPSSTEDSHTYTSDLTGQTISYSLSNGAPPIIRYPGLGDVNMLVQNPDWNLLDECVGNIKGTPVYIAQSGEEEDDDDDDEEEEDEDDEEQSEDDDVVFDIWTVVETSNGGQEQGEGEPQRKVECFEDMFEEWCGLDEM
jgi:hypothetical protein